MDAQTITNIISTVGFPIAACCYMAYAMKDSGDKHKQEMDALKDSLNANTNAIDKLETLINQLLMRMNGKSE